MKKNGNNDNNRGISNVFLCDLHTCCIHDALNAADEMCERLMGAAESLNENAFIGMRFDFKKEEDTTVHTFTSEELSLTGEDLSWLFSGYAELIEDAAADKRMGEVLAARKRLYLLLPSESYDGKSVIRADSRRFVHLMRVLRDEDAILNVNFFPNGSSSIIIALNSEMQLKLRVTLALANPGVRVAEIGYDEANARLCGELSAQSGAGCLKGLSFAHNEVMRVKALELRPDLLDDYNDGFSTADFDDFCDDAADEDKPRPQQTSIDELELSIRARNSLMRAGITAVEELKRMDAERLLKVRNLGRKGAEEVLAKLEAWTKREELKDELLNPSHTLEELVGLGEVKAQVRKIEAYARMKCDMESRGIKSSSMALNMQFIGNPGTAKTTVARILAGILHEIGLLESAEPVEVGRSGLVGRYVGETAQKVRDIFEKADGRLLFIDEAYSLVDERPGLYGDEAINTIVQEMENRRERTIVIFAGYPEEMEGFIDTNPGLHSRVPFTVSFDDYSAEELRDICVLEAKNRGFSIAGSADEKLLHVCEQAVGCVKAGNGRFCRNLVESAILRYAAAHYGAGAQSGEEGTHDFMLEAEHFEMPEGLIPQKKPEKGRIGFAA